jgi:hypothetical protein
MIAIMVAGALVLPTHGVLAAEESATVILKATPVEYMGGHPELTTDDPIDGDLKVTTSGISFTCKKGEFTIDTSKVTRLSGGEFAKRRVKSALIGSILLTPLFLFALIGKKHREILLIEYSDEKASTPEGQEPRLLGAAIFRYKPKNGRGLAIESAVETVTGMKIVKSDEADAATKGKGEEGEKEEEKPG